jgi:hypothetical protein
MSVDRVPRDSQLERDLLFDEAQEEKFEHGSFLRTGRENGAEE